LNPGYLYVLVHPSNPDLYKIGQTNRNPEERLAEHNSNYQEYTGQIVKETGQKWILKEYIEVSDPYWAETVFWQATPLGTPPIRRGIEVEKMKWEWVQAGLDAAKKAGIHPPPKFRTTSVRNQEWMTKQLEGTGITMIGRYRGLATVVDFQCSKGHVFKKSAGVFAKGSRSCPLCSLQQESNLASNG